MTLADVERISDRLYGPRENLTWKKLCERNQPMISGSIHPLFEVGLKKLGLPLDHVPDLGIVNQKLKLLTGFQGIWVTGHEDPKSFFPMLMRRQFPIGDFIRDDRDLGYTPAPDVFHDLYGHLPFLADVQYANFSQKFGEMASRYLDQPHLLRQWERLYWFGVEFSLVKTLDGVRVLGAGVASSRTETEYALSAKPRILPFDLEVIRHREFRIDQLQDTLFILEDPAQLFSCLAEFERGIF